MPTWGLHLWTVSAGGAVTLRGWPLPLGDHTSRSTGVGSQTTGSLKVSMRRRASVARKARWDRLFRFSQETMPEVCSACQVHQTFPSHGLGGVGVPGVTVRGDCPGQPHPSQRAWLVCAAITGHQAMPIYPESASWASGRFLHFGTVGRVGPGRE